MTDISIREYVEATTQLQAKIGLFARITASLHEDAPLLWATVYPRGLGKDPAFYVRGDTFAETLQALKDKWAEFEADHKARTIRKMALAIIRITAELGECTDAALRNCGEFDVGQIKQYGAQACADADDIAGRGPFSILIMGGANAEAA